MIRIVGSHTIIPNQPTPNDPLWLTDSDQMAYLGHVPTIYVYKAKHNPDTIERLKNSLSKILVYYYPVAGRLRMTETGRMEVDCNAKGVMLLEAETTNTFNDYGDFSPSQDTEVLVPKVDYTQERIEDLPLMLVQLTKFNGGEGFAIGIGISHALTDGTASVRFINSWAKLARGEELEPKELPFLDRTVLKFPYKTTTPSVKIPQWKFAADQVVEVRKKTSVNLLKLTSSQVEKLKKKANDQPLKEGVRPYSRFETISGHIWRCASKARESSEDQPTLVRFGVDIRSRLIPPLPPTYFGNALGDTVTSKCCVGELVSNPLSYAAQKIREAVYAVTDEYVRNLFSVVLGEEHLDSIRDFFNGKGSNMGSPIPGNFMMTSWTSMPVYDADFGWGKLVHFGLGTEFREERAVIMQSSDGDGVVVSISLPTSHIQLFKRFFYEDI